MNVSRTLCMRHGVFENGFFSRLRGFCDCGKRRLLLAIAAALMFGLSNVESGEPSAGTSAINEINDPNRLTEIVLDLNENWDVRLQAVKKLTDQALLAKVAMEVPIPVPLAGEIANAAIVNLTDQSLLAKVAIEARDTNVRVHAVSACKPAVEKLTDQSLLAKVAADAQTSDIRVAAIGKITDKAILEKAAVEIIWPDARQAAVEKVKEQPLLAKIAVEDKSWRVQLAAARRVTDQSLLAKIIAENAHPAVQCAAVTNLSDKNFLAHICEKDETRVADIACLKLFLDRPLITSKFNKLNMDVDLQLESQSYVNNYGAQVEVFGEQLTVRIVADGLVLAGALGPAGFPEKLGGYNPSDFLPAEIDISSLVTQLIKDLDQAALVKLTADRYSLVRMAAVRSLEDKATLERIVAEDPSERVRTVAKLKLK
ncbi:MAG: hypothetical protein LLF76_11030 [Planctomycetaceae bacterium]|nr:hypothetical protein [Planctomycetaceae bacterium]